MKMPNAILDDLADKAASDALDRVMRTILLVDDDGDKITILVASIARLSTLAAGVMTVVYGRPTVTIDVLERLYAQVMANAKRVLDDATTVSAIREMMVRKH